MFPRPGYMFHWLTLLFVCLGLISCGGGGDGSSSSANATNQIAVVVDAGPAGANVINALYASVTLCAPGSTNCQTIDHVLVDTGASGVRILASKLEPGLLAALPPSTNGALQQPVAECMQFVSGYSWGSVRTADIKLGGQTASSAMIQVIGDPALPTVPSACSRTGLAFDTVEALGANGIIGLSTFAQDCGHYCASIVSNGVYYACAGAACSPIAVPIENQLWNPVALFPADNNGVVVSLPTVPAAGAVGVNGTLTFGIGTQANNSLGSAIVLTVDSVFGEFGSTVNSISYPGSFIDSGSNGLFYGDGLFPDCVFFLGFYCPPAPQAQSGLLEGLNGASLAVDFTVSNPESLLASNPAVTADAEIAGPGFGGVDWGLPFFFGRSIYIAIEDRSTPTVDGPWVGIK